MVPTSSSKTKISEDVSGDHTAAYPTEQAVRQKEAKKRMKEELEAKGVSQEEIKRLTKRNHIMMTVVHISHHFSKTVDALCFAWNILL